MQKKVDDFASIEEIFIPVKKKYPDKRGVSEKIIKKRLEAEGWEVWRGGMINGPMNEYPNVIRKYQKLDILLREYHREHLEHLKYLCALHHGLPDFICFRRENFKFVECKFGYEQLSERQKKCFQILINMGFKIEVHKLAEPQTKTRKAIYNLSNGKKVIKEKQMKL